jgi:alkyldihydroxyacetonephosphate synthase
MMQAIEQAAQTALAHEGEQVHAYTHLSHVYSSGSSVYSTFMYRLTPDYQRNLQRWQRLKTAVSDAIAEQGGTISHQHGVGQDHEPWLRQEKGRVGCDWLQAVIDRADPDKVFDTGNLLNHRHTTVASSS